MDEFTLRRHAARLSPVAHTLGATAWLVKMQPGTWEADAMLVAAREVWVALAEYFEAIKEEDANAVFVSPEP